MGRLLTSQFADLAAAEIMSISGGFPFRGMSLRRPLSEED
jgi:hypothetical protein